ncbi:MAG: 3'-5' exonuclease [bacterium]
MRKALNLRGRPPKNIAEVAVEVFSVNQDFYQPEEGFWAYKFPSHFDDALKKEHFVAVDIEATGGKPPVEKMVEIGAAKYRNCNEIDEFSFLINPEKPIQPFVAKMTGLDDALLAKAHSLEWVMEKFLDFIKDEVLILHDPFPDMSFIDEASMSCFGGVLINPILDTLTMAKKKLGLHAGLSLNKIADRLEIVQNDHHRALSDARTTVKAYFKLREMDDLPVVEEEDEEEPSE